MGKQVKHVCIVNEWSGAPVKDEGIVKLNIPFQVTKIKLVAFSMTGGDNPNNYIIRSDFLPDGGMLTVTPGMKTGVPNGSATRNIKWYLVSPANPNGQWINGDFRIWVSTITTDSTTGVTSELLSSNGMSLCIHLEFYGETADMRDVKEKKRKF